jgi:hypothetical protein
MGAGEARRFGWRVLVIAALLAATATGITTVAAGAGTAHPSVTTRHVLADDGVINSKN